MRYDNLVDTGGVGYNENADKNIAILDFIVVCRRRYSGTDNRNHTNLCAVSKTRLVQQNGI